MNDLALTRERILDAAEDVLRRFGPGKATVIDVARALGVSHGSVYRHFSSKAALRDACRALAWLLGCSRARAACAPGRILDAAEDVLRRFGPAKATVIDVARALGVSHGSVYRHFSSKAALRDAVLERWLGRVSTARRIVEEEGPAAQRLRRWLDALIAVKRKRCKAIPNCSRPMWRWPPERAR